MPEKKRKQHGTSQWCPIGALHLHTWNYEDDECIWCGPNRLAWQPGVWMDVPSTGFTSSHTAWSTDPKNFEGRRVLQSNGVTS